MKIRPSSVVIASLFAGSSALALLLTVQVDEQRPVYETLQTPRAQASVVESRVHTRPVARPARQRQPETTEPAEPTAPTAPAVEPILPEETSEIITEPQPEVEDEETQTAVVLTAPAEQTASPAPDKQLEATDDFATTVILEIHRLTNQAREKYDLAPLTLDSELSATAETKADDMIEHEYFAHSRPGGCDYTCILENAGYEALAWGENLFQYTTTRPTTATKLASITVESWLKSSGHRANILNPDYTHEGISLVKDGKTFYAVTHFAQPK